MNKHNNDSLMSKSRKERVDGGIYGKLFRAYQKLNVIPVRIVFLVYSLSSSLESRLEYV
jgi:hypothetical protein